MLCFVSLLPLTFLHSLVVLAGGGVTETIAKRYMNQSVYLFYCYMFCCDPLHAC